MKRPEISWIDVNELELDPHNPRLPETLIGSDQETLVRYLYAEEQLEEIARSMVDNGFFAHEPLITRRVAGTDRRTVIEGNRRLATLMILMNLPGANGIGFPDIQLTKAEAELLRRVPCFELEEDADPHDFLGFRHIGGVKTWSAEAKARYLLQEVRTAVEEGSQDPFKDVGRRVGSNSFGVRNSYIALKILLFARDELDIDIASVQLNRFGVWMRCMNASGVLKFIGFAPARTFDEIEKSVQQLKAAKLKEVLLDLSPRSGMKALVQDSRQVTTYGSILSDERAYEILRKTENFAIAAQIVESANLPTRLQQFSVGLETAIAEISHLSNVESELVKQSERLGTVVTSLVQLVKAKSSKS